MGWLGTSHVTGCMSCDTSITTLHRPIPTQTACGLCARCREDITPDLVFFSAFEDLRLQISSTVDSIGIRKLYPSGVHACCTGHTTT